MSVDIPLATAIVEKLLGGAGIGQQRTEPLTEVELSLLAELHQRAAGDLAESLSLLVETKPVASRQESRLELIRASTAGSLLVAFEFEIRMTPPRGMSASPFPPRPSSPSSRRSPGRPPWLASLRDTGRLGMPRGSLGPLQRDRHGVAPGR